MIKNSIQSWDGHSSAEKEEYIKRKLRELSEQVEEIPSAIESASHLPKIEDGTWRTWDAEQGEYVDTEVEATGPQGETGPQGPIGPQGNTGASVDYPYELVNNRTTDDATKGLSAAEGKRLGDDLNQLGQEVTAADERLKAKFDTSAHVTDIHHVSGWSYGDWFYVIGGMRYQLDYTFGAPSSQNKIYVYCRDANQVSLFTAFAVAPDMTTHSGVVTPANDMVVRFEIYGGNERDVTAKVTGQLIATELSERISTLEAETEEIPLVKTNALNGANPFRFGHFHDHIFWETIDGNNVVIPWESLANIEISKRLGFESIEGNLNETSDGHYIVMHGDGYTFGRAVEHIDGVTDISGVRIDSVTLAWIQQNVRFKSIYPKYRVAPATAEEFLLECKKFCMTPFVTASTEAMCRLIDGITGKGNYVALNGNRAFHDGFISTFTNKTTKAGILETCRNFGAPYIYSMSNPDDFTDAELLEIVDALHAEGFFISFAGCYLNEAKSQRLFSLGFDLSGSGWNIPYIESGNLQNISGDIDFSAFATNGVVSNGVLSLADGQTIGLKSTPDTEFLSGAQLIITFTGTLHVTMGKFIKNDLTSDGRRSMIISTYYLQRSPTFIIEAVGAATIESLVFRSSRF